VRKKFLISCLVGATAAVTRTILFQRERSIPAIERSSAGVSYHLIIDQHGRDAFPLYAQLHKFKHLFADPGATALRRQCSVGSRRSPLAERDD
jgi:hypothetical protein